jgi:hypothetical protein
MWSNLDVMHFESAQRKHQRAVDLTTDAGTLIGAFTRGEPPLTITRPSPGQPDIIVKLTNGFDPKLPLVVADAIHNYACVLDHLTWELCRMERKKKPDQWLQFPRWKGTTVKEQQERRAKVKKRLEPYFHQPTVDFLLSLDARPLLPGEPMKDPRGQFLHYLIQADNMDKHRTLLPAVGMGVVYPLVVTNQNGERIPYPVDADQKDFEFDSSGELRVRTTFPGLKVELQDDADVALRVLFRNDPALPFPRWEVRSVLSTGYPRNVIIAFSGHAMKMGYISP